MKKSSHHFDALVIGSGLSGSWVAKELCDLGIKTLVLERGKPVEHIKDYPTAFMDPWEFKHRNQVPSDVLIKNPIASKCYAFKEDTLHLFTPDDVQPYIQEEPFDWIRCYQVGGKSLTWARQVQRWSDFDFNGPKRDGFAVDWPIRYQDIAPWYSRVEHFIGVSGNKDGLESMPDGDFLPPFEMNKVERLLQREIERAFPNRRVIQGRCAHLTELRPIHKKQGRTLCQARSLCQRGCPFGGYYSANASTLPWAEKTGNLTLRSNAIVHSILFDPEKNRATGVRVIDAQTRETTEYFADVLFLNASTLATNQILLNSTSSRFPQGLGNDNGLLGKYITFHNYMGTISGTVDGHLDSYYYGRRPTQPIIPNFRNVDRQETDFLRGYASFFSAYRTRGTPGDKTVGGPFKDSLTEAGPWHISMMMQGETIPKEENHVRLSAEHSDSFGIPQLITHVKYDENDVLSRDDFFEQGSMMLDAAGVKNIRTHNSGQNPGLDIHEMGGVRMGLDPETSLLNKWNQLHSCKNVYVTDGACMTSTGTQNPSLTFMALAARAANHAVEALKKGDLK